MYVSSCPALLLLSSLSCVTIAMAPCKQCGGVRARQLHNMFSNSLLSCLTKLNMRPRTFTEHILISTATVGVYIQLYVLFCVCCVIIESDVVMFVREWM